MRSPIWAPRPPEALYLVMIPIQLVASLLSGYTVFETISPTGALKISVDVANTGPRTGDEVVQLYVRRLGSTVTQARQKLEGFARVEIAAGQKRTVQLELAARQLAHWDVKHQRFVVEPGEVSYRDLIADLDKGLLITHGLGFHSGNYPQGQFSVQAVGYHIVNGKVVGRLIKTMISANIYEDFKNVRALSSEHRAGMMGLLGGITPYILVDAIQVAGA